MTNRLTSIACAAAVAAVAFTLVPSLAAAQSVTSSVTGAVTSAAQVAVPTDASASTSVTVGAGAGTDSSSTVTASGTEASGAAVSPLGISTLSLTRAGLSSDTSANAGMSAAAVISSDDLNAYAQSAMNTDANIQAMNATADNASVSYKERAYFLGFIPASITTTATADANGEVTVSYPWYGFLFRKPSASLKSNLDTAVKASVNQVGGAQATAGGTLDAGEQASLLEALRSALATQHSADYGTTAAVSASGSAAAGGGSPSGY